MDLINLIEVYTKAQKASGFHFVIMGGGLISCAILVQLIFKNSDFSQGFKVSALICGLLFSAMGLSYSSFVLNQKMSIVKDFKKNPANTFENEKERIEKVLKQFPIYQFIFGTIVFVSLLVILFIPSYLWKGASYALLFTFSLSMLIENISSYPSMVSYQKGILTIENSHMP